MIRIQNLQHRYPDGTDALRGIDLVISKGEFLLICGPNGSGKTTLLRIMGGLLEPSDGSVLINGFDSSKNVLEARRSVGMVFQDPDCQIVGETVREDVAFGPENLGLSKEEINQRVDGVLSKMGLAELSEKPCDLLSGGEKRRLAIAGVLAMSPEVLLFDEPFSYLDYPGVREVLRHMIQLHREGHTLIVTTHDVEKVMAHVDRMAILQAGEIKASGTPEQLVGELRRFGVRPPCYALEARERMTWLD
ncbi:MAG: Cobalt import ATP-binding protein CbiO [Betaproteobacteria bacterium ADurb.Bin341]|nr:MAG: Cobalt import ATP-binding protein CbiO [Betaproteobacteria bacterium ADurb.Bin341]